jgi:hypothetical protein
MNRRDRRRYQPRDHRVEQTGQPGRIHGLTGACRDCGATGDLVLLPGHRTIGHIWHDEGCPAATGITPWQPHPLHEGTQPPA